MSNHHRCVTRSCEVGLHLVQALVEQCSAAGQPEQVERSVLHMDVASLDFSQVRFGCEQ